MSAWCWCWLHHPKHLGACCCLKAVKNKTLYNITCPASLHVRCKYRSGVTQVASDSPLAVIFIVQPFLALHATAFTPLICSYYSTRWIQVASAWRLHSRPAAWPAPPRGAATPAGAQRCWCRLRHCGPEQSLVRRAWQHVPQWAARVSLCSRCEVWLPMPVAPLTVQSACRPAGDKKALSRDDEPEE